MRSLVQTFSNSRTLIAKRQEEATKSINNELQDLYEQFKQGTSELAGMGVVWIPIRAISGLCSSFFAIIWLLLGVVITWSTYRRICLVRTNCLLSQDDAGEDLLRLL
jgi:hypothetical protein